MTSNQLINNVSNLHFSHLDIIFYQSFNRTTPPGSRTQHQNYPKKIINKKKCTKKNLLNHKRKGTEKAKQKQVPMLIYDLLSIFYQNYPNILIRKSAQSSFFLLLFLFILFYFILFLFYECTKQSLHLKTIKGVTFQEPRMSFAKS